MIETLRDAREKAKEGGKSVLVEGPGVLNEKPTWRSLESGVVVEPNGKCHFMSQE